MHSSLSLWGNKNKKNIYCFFLSFPNFCSNKGSLPQKSRFSQFKKYTFFFDKMLNVFDTDLNSESSVAMRKQKGALFTPIAFVLSQVQLQKRETHN